MPLQSAQANVILVGSFPVGKVGQLHRFNDTIHNHGRAEPCSKAKKEHLSSAVAPYRLHGGVIDDLHWTAKCTREIEPNPAAS